MDADYKEKRRARRAAQREKRWSMNSQRLEEIVAQLMQPIGDLRRSFDTDLSALLEEYLTEAGLHALAEEEEAEPAAGAAPAQPPNFVELALLLQQSASIYGRKVDFLYQHVLSVSDSLHSSTLDIANTSSEEAATPGSGRRGRRRASAAAGVAAAFAPIALEASAGARREPGAARPPPTLPRMYLELEPRVLAPVDRALLDYAGEPIGLLQDFHVAWRLQGGMLVDELEVDGACASRAALRPIPLMELQAAIEANAPPPPPPVTPPPCSSPAPDAPPPPDAPAAPDAPPPPDAPAAPTPPPVKRERKRRNDEHMDAAAPTTLKIVITEEMRRALSAEREFELPFPWVRVYVRARITELQNLRLGLLAPPEDACAEFRGFDYSILDKEGFVGWSSMEAALASTRVPSTRLPSVHESDDDGFFEQSSLGDSDASRAEEAPAQGAGGDAEWAAWQARVVARAAAAEARGVDVRQLAARVLAALPAPPEHAPFTRVLAEAAREPADVSTLFLATLFLANSGNVEVQPGPPLSVDSFSVRLVSADVGRLRATDPADPQPG